jgi:hypothetical protein
MGRGIDELQGDNRRKKLLGAMASALAGVCWGGSRLGWFFVHSGTSETQPVYGRTGVENFGEVRF